MVDSGFNCRKHMWARLRRRIRRRRRRSEM
jgi:hypothetical protein